MTDHAWTHDQIAARHMTVYGIELLNAIKLLRPETPVIIMTAWATLETAIEAMRSGASDFIQKPWDNAQVVNTVRAQVMRGQLMRRASNHSV